MTMHRFPILPGVLFQEDGGYEILSGLSKNFPFLHGRHDLQIAPVRGTRTKTKGVLITDKKSYLYVRGLTEQEAAILSYSYFVVKSSIMHLGKPEECQLQASSALVSRLVVFEANRAQVDENFMLEKLMQRLPKTSTIILGRQRTIEVKGTHFVGFGVRIEDLTDTESLAIQNSGIGKFTSMGCGVFGPVTAGRGVT